MQSNRDMKGKKIWTVAAGSACLLVGCAQQPQGYAEKILSNPLMNRVDSMERAVVATGFNEWYTPAGEPMGSGTFRGEAGVLYKANALLSHSVQRVRAVVDEVYVRHRVHSLHAKHICRIAGFCGR